MIRSTRVIDQQVQDYQSIKMPAQIQYSEKYFDDVYEYRYVIFYVMAILVAWIEKELSSLTGRSALARWN